MFAIPRSLSRLDQRYPCYHARHAEPALVLQNPLSLTTLQAPSNHSDRKEKNGIRNRLLVVFHACSASLPYLFRISSHLQPLPSRGRTDARSREVCLALALPERPPTLCPHAHLPDWGRCESDLRCQPHHQSTQSHGFSPSPALWPSAAHHPRIACYGPIKALYNEGSI